MVDSERLVVERFPEHKEAIHALSESNSHFNALCHQYEDTSRKLYRLEHAPNLYVKVETEMLSRRCAALEDEIFAVMQQNRCA